ncbi:class I SAM-dependent methyltransferase [Luminiphilus sp.]|nr:class I SAM-dependent methyltransferase [Luminiphilus sp.]
MIRRLAKKISVQIDNNRFDTALLADLVFVNIGAGITRIDGAVNIDISPKADVSLTLGVDPLPFDDESVDLIYSDHTIEHVENYLSLMGEISRVLKKGGCLLVGVPYVTLTKYHLVNPYHLHNFNEYSFDFFDPTKLRGSAAEDQAIDLRRLNHCYGYLGVFRFIPIFRSIFRHYLFNIVRDIKFAVVKGDSPSALTLQLANNLPSAYRSISSLRKRY